MKDEEFINVEMDIREKMDVTFHIGDIMFAINNADLQRKWNTIAGILNAIDPSVDELTTEHKTLIKTFLQKQLTKFE